MISNYDENVCYKHMQMNILCITYHIHRRCFPVYPTPFWIPDRLYHLKKCKYFQKAIPSKDIIRDCLKMVSYIY